MAEEDQILVWDDNDEGKSFLQGKGRVACAQLAGHWKRYHVFLVEDNLRESRHTADDWPFGQPTSLSIRVSKDFYISFVRDRLMEKWEVGENVLCALNG